MFQPPKPPPPPWELLPPLPFSKRSKERRTQRTQRRHIEPVNIVSNVTTEQTIAYQNRELAKTLLALETHLAQGCRVMGVECDCCSGRHPLELEKFSEEALAMSGKSIYLDIIEFAREIEQKANVDAIRSRDYDADYPVMSVHARDLRKQLAVDAVDKAAQALDIIHSEKEEE